MIITIDFEVVRESGMFVSKNEVADAIIAEIEGNLIEVEDSSYNVISSSVHYCLKAEKKVRK